MHLRDYLILKRITETAFGRTIGVAQATVNRWCERRRVPRPKYVALIKSVTKGLVTELDWYTNIEAAALPKAKPPRKESSPGRVAPSKR